MLFALGVDFVDPFLADRPGGSAAFAANNRPVNAGKIDVADRPNQGLERYESNRGGRCTKVVDAPDDSGILDAGAKPDVGKHLSNEPETTAAIRSGRLVRI